MPKPYLIAACVLAAAVSHADAPTSSSLHHAATTAPALPPCAPLPSEPLSDADLARLVPANSPGKVRVAWKTESQEDTYGFNILRSRRAEGPYARINTAAFPGEGTSSSPKSYCFEDNSVARGEVYFYQVEEVTNQGARTIIEGTAATRVKVKTVEEERAWLKKKAADAANAPTAPEPKPNR